MLLKEILKLISTHLDIPDKNLIDLNTCNDKSEEEIMEMIGNLSVKKMDETVLYCSTTEMSDFRKYLFSIAFKIESLKNTNTLIFFYKGDVFYDRIDLITESKIKNFLNRSSYDEYTVCQICNGEKYNLMSCTVCVGSFCKDCALNFKKKECPYCKTDISSFFVNIT